MRKLVDEPLYNLQAEATYYYHDAHDDCGNIARRHFRLIHMASLCHVHAMARKLRKEEG
jgi:hypothetical protein